MEILERHDVTDPEYKNKFAKMLFHSKEKEMFQAMSMFNFQSWVNEMDEISKTRESNNPMGALINRGELRQFSNALFLAIGHGRPEILRMLKGKFIEDNVKLKEIQLLGHCVQFLMLKKKPERTLVTIVKNLFEPANSLEERCIEFFKAMINHPEFKKEIPFFKESDESKIRGIEDCFDLLLEWSMGFDNLPTFPAKIEHNMLTYLVQFGEIDLVRKLIQKYPESVNFPISGGYTPIYFARQNKDNAMVELLLGHGADERYPTQRRA